MIHARDDYNRIQDPEFKIGKNEPVFLLRAKDKFAPIVVKLWAELVTASGDVELAQHVRKHAYRMEDWQTKHECKIPDSPEIGFGKEL